MKILPILVLQAVLHVVTVCGSEVPERDWLVDPTSYSASVSVDDARQELIVTNGLARRVLRLTPNAATTGLENLVSGEQLVRAVGPEAYVTLDGVSYAIGGLDGQPVGNYLKTEWLTSMTASPHAFRFVDWKSEPIQPRFGWKKRVEWLPRDLPWPPPGRHVTMRYRPPADNAPTPTDDPSKRANARSDLPEVEVHYEIYDGIPLFSKWLVVRNSTSRQVLVNGFVCEELRLAEVESCVEHAPNTEHYNLIVESDYAFGAMDAAHANNKAVHLEPDPNYPTQVNYSCRTPCLLRCYPKTGPAQHVAPGQDFASFRIFELLLDSTDRERRGLAQRRMYRVLAPWTAENPLMFHKLESQPDAVREAIRQCRETGFEMVIMSFGSGFDFENADPQYRMVYTQLAEEAHAQKIALGGYTLTASRSAADPQDNTQGQQAAYGVMPCLGSKWGVQYHHRIKDFVRDARLDMLENDGPYPGDMCAGTNHPEHRGLDDSQWVQWQAQAGLYKWCRAEGIFVNQPDWYFLSGGSKCGMGYRETNWSLPRAEQEVIERQNIYDGTWTKAQSMGWMFVPLSEYQGGGAAATIEPLHEHLDHYESRLANLIGSGTQACYRGPRLFDTDETKTLVKKWVDFYKRHRQVLGGELIHLRRASGRDWDGWLLVNPQGLEKGVAFFFNPLAEVIEREIRVPLHYAGLSGRVKVSFEGGKSAVVMLSADQMATINVRVPPRGHYWLLFTGADD